MQSTAREFQLIHHYFQRHAQYDQSVALGIGDDCALIEANPAMQQAISVDTSIAGRHFPQDADAYFIARRALNVSVSDLAAMGAIPRWFTLAISLPDMNAAWLERFSEGLFSAAKDANIQLIGGDTTKSRELSITIQVHGEVEKGQALKRSGAQVGDTIYVTGVLGSAAAGLDLYQQGERAGNLLSAYLDPVPQLSKGRALLKVASSCIDISDGLLGDLSHILAASHCAAQLDLAAIPLAQDNIERFGKVRALNWALNGGDDYQLCFTSQLSQAQLLEQGIEAFAIGTICQGTGITCINALAGVDCTIRGFDHFYEPAI